MNEHDDIRLQLSAYLDGELDAPAARRIEQAVADDPALAGELAELRTVRDLLRALPRRTAPPTFVADVLAAAERPRLVTAPHHEAHRAFWAARVLAAAAGFLIFLAVGAVVVAMLWNTPAIDSVPGDDVASAPAPPSPPTPETDSPRERRWTNTQPPVIAVEDPAPPALLDPEHTAGDLHGLGGSGRVLAADFREEIYTDDIETTNRKIVELCNDNGIIPAASAPADPCDIPEVGLNNFAVQRTGDEQLQVYVVAPAGRVQRVLEGLEEVRSEQRVPQAPEGDAIASVPSRLRSSEPAASGPRHADSAREYAGEEEARLAVAAAPACPTTRTAAPTPPDTEGSEARTSADARKIEQVLSDDIRADRGNGPASCPHVQSVVITLNLRSAGQQTVADVTDAHVPGDSPTTAPAAAPPPPATQPAATQPTTQPTTQPAAQPATTQPAKPPHAAPASTETRPTTAPGSESE